MLGKGITQFEIMAAEENNKSTGLSNESNEFFDSLIDSPNIMTTIINSTSGIFGSVFSLVLFLLLLIPTLIVLKLGISIIEVIISFIKWIYNKAEYWVKINPILKKFEAKINNAYSEALSVSGKLMKEVNNDLKKQSISASVYLHKNFKKDKFIDDVSKSIAHAVRKVSNDIEIEYPTLLMIECSKSDTASVINTVAEQCKIASTKNVQLKIISYKDTGIIFIKQEIVIGCTLHIGDMSTDLNKLKSIMTDAAKDFYKSMNIQLKR